MVWWKEDVLEQVKSRARISLPFYLLSKDLRIFETNLVENIIFYTDWPAFVIKYLGGSILNRNLANLTKRLLNNIQQHIWQNQTSSAKWGNHFYWDSQIDHYDETVALLGKEQLLALARALYKCYVAAWSMQY